MRIIAGRAGGRRLHSPESLRIRPTPERVREALFSILGDIEGAVVVDGFAGTGALGCEALSRGAQFCYFVDPSAEAAEIIEENLARIDGGGFATILRGRFERQLSMIDRDPDLWLLDPPYHRELGATALNAMRSASCVTEGTLVVLEQDDAEPVVEVDGFHLEDQRVYGRSRLCFYRRRDTAK